MRDKNNLKKEKKDKKNMKFADKLTSINYNLLAQNPNTSTNKQEILNCAITKDYLDNVLQFWIKKIFPGNNFLTPITTYGYTQDLKYIFELSENEYYTVIFPKNYGLVAIKTQEIKNISEFDYQKTYKILECFESAEKRQQYIDNLTKD